jgi:hypothetical protein
LMFHIVQGNKTPSFFELFFLKLNWNLFLKINENKPLKQQELQVPLH